MEKVIKFGATEIEKQYCQWHKETIPIKSIDIDKIAVSNKVSFGKKRLKYFIGYKDAKKLGLYVCFSQKWLHIEKTLMKLNINMCLFI